MSDEVIESGSNAWQRAEHRPPLDGASVHVWRLRIPAVTATLDGLVPGEIERASRLREPARSRFVATRHALRIRLGDYLGRAGDSLEFDYGETGKPVLRADPELHFSVAHSGDLALLAFARSPVGIDLERIRRVPRQARIAPRVLAPDSVLALAALPAQERDDAFIWTWTQREAYVKAIGGGVLRSHDPLPFLWPPRLHEAAGWTVVPLAADARHHACLVVEGTARPVLLEYD